MRRAQSAKDRPPRRLRDARLQRRPHAHRLRRPAAPHRQSRRRHITRRDAVAHRGLRQNSRGSHAWILGGGWDHTKWPTKTLPTRQDLDAVTGGHPAFLGASTATSPSPTPPHSKPLASTPPHPIPSAATSIATRRANPPASFAKPPRVPSSKNTSLRPAMTCAARPSNSPSRTRSLTASPPCRTSPPGTTGSSSKPSSTKTNFPSASPNGSTSTSRRRPQAAPRQPRLQRSPAASRHAQGLHGRLTRLAAPPPWAPYSDEPANSGIPRYEQDNLNQMASERAIAGFQLGFHAIGDRANDMALNAFQAAQQAGVPETDFLCEGHEAAANRKLPPDAIVQTAIPATPHRIAPNEFRFRIEHAQVVSPGDFQRFHDLGIIASMQPSHLLTDMAWATSASAPNAPSTPTPGAPSSPRRPPRLRHRLPRRIHQSLPRPLLRHHAPERSRNPNLPAPGKTHPQRSHLRLHAGLSLRRVAEKNKGQLAPGYLADLVVLDRDITKATPQEILHTRVLRTVVGGVTRYTAP